MTRGEFEKNKLNQKVRDLETQLQISAKDTQELSESYQKMVKEKNALMQQLTMFEKDSFEIQTRVKRGLEAERDVQEKQVVMENMKDKERDLERELNKQKTDCELKQSEIERLHAKIETIQSYNSTLEKEISEVRAQVSELNSKVSDGADQTVKNQNMKNKAELQIVDLKQNLTLVKDENTRLQNDLGQSQKDLSAEKTKTENLTTQVERMRSLVENLDQTKDELL